MGVIDNAQSGSPSALRRANRRRLLVLLETGEELSQADLARSTGLAPATVSNIVRELVADRVLTVVGRAGRARLLRMDEGSGLAMGIDVGHRHITVALVSRAGEVQAERRHDIPHNLAALDAADLITGSFASLLEESGMRPDGLIGVGMGVPTPIDSETRRVAAPSILPGWVDVDIAELVSSRVGLPVVVDNDANLGALAEHAWGAGRGLESLAYIKLSEGVGAGLILGGELYRGRQGIAGEIGHTTMDEFGRVCRCGNRGCLETMVAARAVVNLLEPVRGPDLSIAEVVRLAEGGDAACARVLSDTGRHVGVALANVCNVFNPERILIGGELAQAGNFLLAPIREVVRRQGIPTATASLTIELAALGAHTHVVGAALLAMRASASPPDVHNMNTTAAIS